MTSICDYQKTRHVTKTKYAAFQESLHEMLDKQTVESVMSKFKDIFDFDPEKSMYHEAIKRNAKAFREKKRLEKLQTALNKDT